MIQTKQTNQLLEISIRPSQPLIHPIFNILFLLTWLCGMAYLANSYLNKPSIALSNYLTLAISLIVTLFLGYGFWGLLNAGLLGKATIHIDTTKQTLRYQKNYLLMHLTTWEAPYQYIEFMYVDKANSLRHLKALNKIWDNVVAILIDDEKLISTQLYLNKKDIQRLIQLTPKSS